MREREGKTAAQARAARQSRAANGLWGMLGIWQMAIRPRTLLLSVSPVLAATFWAWREIGVQRLEVLPLAIAGAVGIQIGTNLLNDAADAARGVDRADRIGPPRVVAEGLLNGAQTRFAAFLFFALAALAGLGLIAIGGWPIALLGVVSIACGALYSLGPRPIAFTPLGEVLVIVFFGIAAFGGTYYLHTGQFDPGIAALGAVFGIPAAGVLLVNNHRDRKSDARAGRRTLAILIGARGSRFVYGAMMLVSVPLLALVTGTLCPLGLAVLGPLALFNGWLAWRMARLPVSPALNGLIGATAASQLLMLLALAILSVACGS